MSLETGTFTDDFDTNNPVATDTKSQGDDHLRWIKLAIKNTIKRASRAFYIPGASASKTADFSVAASDDNRTFLVDTTAGAVTATLPTLVSADAGWECSFIKTNTGTSALFIAPASGTIQSGEVSGLAKTRRCIPGHKTRVFWTGSSWFAERVVRTPVGAVITMGVAGLPVGYEWPNGQTLSGTAGSVYPDYYSANASSLVTIDHRGRASFGTDTLGTGPAGRVTNTVSGIVGATFAATGGLESFLIGIPNLPNIAPGFTGAPSTPVIVPLHDGSGHNVDALTNNASADGGIYVVVATGVGTTIYRANTSSTNGGVTVPAITPSGTIDSINGNVTQTVISKMPPTIMLNKVLVVE